MKKKKVYAKGMVWKLRTPAIPSEHMDGLDSLPPHQPVLIYGRESSRKQSKNLEPQISELKKSVETLGFRVMDSFAEIAPGWMDDRTEFSRVIAKAKELGLAIVAEATSRFWRNPHRNDGFLSLLDIERLMAETDGVQLVTLLHPDTPEKEVRRYQTKRGQVGKNRRGGRPKLSAMERRLKMRPLVIEMWADGFSKRRIHRELGVPQTTVWKWIENEKMDRGSTWSLGPRP